MGKRAGKRASALDQQRSAHQRKVHGDWAKRHPRLAREERRLRLENFYAMADYGHKLNGTPQTHAKAAQTRQGALARLYLAGTIDSEQLAAAAAIASVAERIGRDVGIRTVSFETRVDSTPRFDGTFFEALGAVRAEVAYTRWRKALIDPGPVLAMIVDDVGISVAARRYGMRNATAKGLLISALDLWSALLEVAYKEISSAELAAWHAGLV